MALPPRITFPRPPASLRSRAVRTAVLGVPSRGVQAEDPSPIFALGSLRDDRLLARETFGGTGNLSASETDFGAFAWQADQGEYALGSGKAIATAAAATHIINTFDAGGAYVDLDVEIDRLITGGSNLRSQAGVVFNFVDTDNYWRLVLTGTLNVPGGTAQLIEVTGGADVVHVSQSYYMAVESRRWLRVFADGDRIVVDLYGIQVLDTTIVGRAHKTATRVGVYTFRPTSGSPDDGSPFLHLSLYDRVRTLAAALPVEPDETFYRVTDDGLVRVTDDGLVRIIDLG